MNDYCILRRRLDIGPTSTRVVLLIMCDHGARIAKLLGLTSDRYPSDADGVGWIPVRRRGGGYIGDFSCVYMHLCIYLDVCLSCKICKVKLIIYVMCLCPFSAHHIFTWALLCKHAISCQYRAGTGPMLPGCGDDAASGFE